jgi:hypothetical protein
MKAPILLLLAACAVVYSAMPAQGKASDQLVQYQAPLPDARLVSRHTTIILRLESLLDRSSLVGHSLFTVQGSASGRHDGSTVMSDDGRTIIFKPEVPFAPGEKVSVMLSSGLRTVQGGTIPPRSFSFTVSPKPAHQYGTTELLAGFAAASDDPVLRASVPAITEKQGGQVLAGALPSDLALPTVLVSNNPSPGHIYQSQYSLGGTLTPYLLTIDNAAAPIYYRPATTQILDFRMQPNGMRTYFDYNGSVFYVINAANEIVDSIRCSNGYLTDGHELLLLPNGHWLLLGFDPQPVDMSTIVAGGKTTATVLGAVIQELDAEKNVVFEWRSFDFIPITDATHEVLTAAAIDYVHPNGLEVDTDGNILLSSRHLDEITKISRSTGEIIWRLGGKNNQFTFVNDTIGFSHQHSIRRIANGNVILFDNGNFHTVKNSRAIEYRLDEQNKTATLVWQYRHTPNLYSSAMGSVQRLPNGNTLIGWGSLPRVTEVDSAGTTRLEMLLPTNLISYRAFRFPGPSSPTTFLRTPLDRSANTSLAPLMQWRAAVGAISYQLQIALDPGFEQIVENDSALTTLSRRADTLDQDVRYYWRVRFIGTSEPGQWSETWTFRTGIDRVVLLSPARDSTELPVDLSLSWKSVAGAASYQVRVFTDTNDIGIEELGVEGTSRRIEELEYGRRYYWRVRAMSEASVGEWSETWAFQTKEIPSLIFLLSPVNGSTDVSVSPSLSWTPVKGATAYRLQISAWDAGFSNPAFNQTINPDTAFRVQGLDSNATYYWRVQAMMGEQEGMWSETWYFKTSSSPSAQLPVPVTLLLPPPNAAVQSNNSMQFVWDQSQPLSTFTRYHFQLSDDSSFQQVTVDSTVLDTTVTIVRQRLAASKYWWRVSAINQAGEGEFSEVRSFDVSTAASVPGLMGLHGAELSLWSSAPNPFTSATIIRFALRSSAYVHVRIIDMDGKEVATLFDGSAESGPHDIVFDPTGLPEGNYLCILSTPRATLTQRLLLVR